MGAAQIFERCVRITAQKQWTDAVIPYQVDQLFMG